MLAPGKVLAEVVIGLVLVAGCWLDPLVAATVAFVLAADFEVVLLVALVTPCFGGALNTGDTFPALTFFASFSFSRLATVRLLAEATDTGAFPLEVAGPVGLFDSGNSPLPLVAGRAPCVIFASAFLSCSGVSGGDSLTPNCAAKDIDSCSS